MIIYLVEYEFVNIVMIIFWNVIIIFVLFIRLFYGKSPIFRDIFIAIILVSYLFELYGV